MRGKFLLIGAFAVLLLATSSFLVFSENFFGILPFRPNLTGYAVFEGTEISAVSSGSWGNPGTWNLGRVPGEGDSVIIPSGMEVELAGNAYAQDIRVLGGVLRASRSQDSFLNLTNSLAVLQGGTLDYGVEGDPIPSNVEAVIGFNIADDREFLTNDQPSPIPSMPEYHPEDTGIWTMGSGTTTSFYGAEKSFVWTKIDGDLEIGDTSLTLAESPSGAGWNVGDMIMIGPTRESEDIEFRVISSINGRTISFSEPLENFHDGSYYAFDLSTNETRKLSDAGEVQGGEKLIEARGTVAVMNHNVRVQSNLVQEGDANHRAHILWMMGSGGGASFAEFRDLGTRAVLGRYPIHMHRLGQAGNDFVVYKNSIWSTVSDPSNKWVVIHETVGANVTGNAAFNTQGRGYYMEDANELNNSVIGNLGVGVHYPEELINHVTPEGFQLDEGSAAFWMREGNVVKDNVAAGAHAFTAGYWFTQNSEGYNPAETEFENNEVHGSAIGVYWTGKDGFDFTRFNNGKIWQVHSGWVDFGEFTFGHTNSDIWGTGLLAFTGDRGDLSGSKIIPYYYDRKIVMDSLASGGGYVSDPSYDAHYKVYDGLLVEDKVKNFVLNDGYNVINWTETVLSGEEIYQENYVRLETKDPEIEIPGELNPTTVRNPNYRVSYLVKEGGVEFPKYSDFVLNPGNNILTVNSTDIYGNIGFGSIAVNYDDSLGNRAPVVIGENSYFVRESEVLEFDLSADDPDGDLITEYDLKYYINGVEQGSLPSFLYYRSETSYPSDYGSYSSGTVQRANHVVWQPTYEQQGTHDFVFEATDARGAKGTKSFTIVVEDDPSEEPYFQVRSYYDRGIFSCVLGASLDPNKEILEGGSWSLYFRILGPNPDQYRLSFAGFDGFSFPSEDCSANGADETKKIISSVNHDIDDYGAVMGVVNITDLSGNVVKTQEITIDHYGGTLDPAGAIFLTVTHDDGSRASGPVDFSLSRQEAGLKYRILLNGEAISPILNSSDSYTWDSTSVPDGSYVLGPDYIEGNLAQRFIGEDTLLIVDNIPGPANGVQEMPSNFVKVENQRLVNRYSFRDPRFNFTGQLEKNFVYPYPYQYVQPERYSDVNMQSISRIFIEPITTIPAQYSSGLAALSASSLDGQVSVGSFQHQAGKSSGEASGQDVDLKNNKDGQRGENYVSSYTTFAPDPLGPGWYGIELTGKLFKLSPEGTVETIVGRVSDSDSFSPISGDTNKRLVGNFPDGEFNIANDMYFDPHDPKTIFVADTFNHRIAKVDLRNETPIVTTFAGSYGQAGHVDGEQARFNEPYSIVIDWVDRAMYVADLKNDAVRKIYPNGTVTTILDDNNLANGEYIPVPQVLRLDSEGKLVVGQLGGAQRVFSFDIENREVENLFGTPASDSWIWLDVDWRGNIGTKDDIIVATTINSGWPGGAAYNVGFGRFDRDGSNGRQLYGPLQTTGHMSHGAANRVGQVGGHYGWSMVADDEEGRFITTGMGSIGPYFARRTLPGDPSDPGYGSPNNYYRNFDRGADFINRGSYRVVPYGMRSKIRNLYSGDGRTMIGNIPSFDDLGYLSDEQLEDYIISGFGSLTPRPEMYGQGVRDLTYFVRQNSLFGNLNTVNLGSVSDTDGPESFNFSLVNLGDNRALLRWNTNEDTIGFAYYGDQGLEHYTDIEFWHTRNHEVLLKGVEEGEKIYFSIRSIDLGGNSDSQTVALVVPSLDTCSELSGTVCNDGDSCSVEFIDSSDSSLCCLGSCIGPDECYDGDGDGYNRSSTGSCGVVDCNDGDPGVYQELMGYLDSDGDGYTTGGAIEVCVGDSLPAGLVETQNGEDCNDGNPSVNPGASEVCGDGLDNDCNGFGDCLDSVCSELESCNLESLCLAQQDLVGYWPLDGTAEDLKAGNDGIVTGAEVINGKIGEGYLFNGSGQGIATEGNAGISGSQERTLAFWAKADAAENVGTGVQQYLAGLGVSNDIPGSRFSALTKNSDWFYWFLGSTSDDLETGVPVEVGEWQFHVLTYDGSQSKWYINGNEIASKNNNLNTPQGPLEMGRTIHDYPGRPGGPVALEFLGSIDEVSLWNRVLTSSEIQELYGEGSGIQACYLGSETGGEVPEDVDLDGDVDLADLARVALSFGDSGCSSTDPVNCDGADVTRDGFVNIVDMIRVAISFS